MKLTLDTLKKTGAFTGRPVEKEIKWKGADGENTLPQLMFALWVITLLRLTFSPG